MLILRGRRGVSATNEEKQEAWAVADAVQRYLEQLRWSHPIVADSGNGYHLLYPIDLPTNTESTELIKGILNALGKRFDSPEAMIDRAVYNAARICKAYGSIAAPEEKVEQTTTPVEEVSNHADADLMEEFLDTYGIRYRPRAEYNGAVEVDSRGVSVRQHSQWY